MENFDFDEKYIEGLRKEDPGTIAHFVSYFAQRSQVLARNKLGSRLPHMVEDAVQIALMRVIFFFRADKPFGAPKCLPAFVLTTGRNVCLEILRRERPYAPVDGTDFQDFRQKIHEALERKEQIGQVVEAIQKLPERDREVLIAELQGAEREELCRRFNLSPENLRTVRCRALKRLRKELGTDADGDRDK